MERNEDGFFERCEEARKLAFSFKEPLIVHHYDADGLSSGAIVAGSFLKKGKKFRRECIKKLDDAAIGHLLREPEVIFVDLGGGNKRVNELKDVLIIDHHQTEGIDKFQANPMLFGIDGGYELSASGTAYFVFREYPELGIVGAVGDMQRPFSGMNKKLVEEGVAKGRVKVEEDLVFYGRYCRPLVQFLAYSDDPYIPGISYREDKAAELLADLKIPVESVGKIRVYADLDNEEKKTLVSALVKVLASGRKEVELVGESYVFPERPKDETYEANEFSTLLNACGRHSKPEIGVRVCLGEADAYEEARSLLQLHRKMLREGVVYAESGVQDLGKFFFLDGRGRIDEGIVGVVCGMVLRQGWKKPLIGVAHGENKTIKVSSRASRVAAGGGINLGTLMREAAADVGGIGGGHKVAAGASIPEDRLNEFLLAAGRRLS